MRNSIFSSFRFKIVFYSLLSLLFTILTEAFILIIGIVIKIFIIDVKPTKILNSSDTLRDLPIPPNNLMKGQQYKDSFIQNEQNTNLYLIFLIGTAAVIGIVLFIMYFLLLTKKYVSYMQEITAGIIDISSGNFKTRIPIRNEDEFAQIAGQINHMADDISKMMEHERMNESAKNELIASVAHDLRTPLTSIIGYLDLVSRQSNLSDDVKKNYLLIAYDKSKRLEKLIEDLFTYTKFSFGQIAMSYQNVDMVQFIEQLLEEFYPSFQEFNLIYEFKTNTNKAIIHADGDLLVRAFANLISNAVKYGKHGKKIKISLCKELDKIHVVITNYGEMIPQKDINHIFDKFYRVESSRSDDTGGSGLGLAIAKNIISMHGGTITAQSDYRGTVFEVILDCVGRKETK